MNLEQHRKNAKRLLRDVRAGAPDGLATAWRVLGDRAGQRFQLSDALHVVAREQGYSSWPELKHAVAQEQPRIETKVDTGLEYRPGHPVRVMVVRRGPRISVSDEGIALALAGRPRNWQQAARRTGEELVVNFSRGGAISLPVVPVGPSEEAVVRRIGQASRAFYQELLELP